MRNGVADVPPRQAVQVEPWPGPSNVVLGCSIPKDATCAVSLTAEQIESYARNLRTSAIERGMTAVDLDCGVCKTTVFLRRGRAWSFMAFGIDADGDSFLKFSLVDDVATEMRRLVQNGGDVQKFVNG